MIGTAAFFNEASFVFVPLALLLLVAFFALRTPKSKKTTAPIRGGIATVVLLAMPIVFGLKLISEVREHVVLSRLSANEIQAITIGSTKINDVGQVTRITQALHQSQWFSPNHGGWAPPVRFDVQMKNGETHEYRVATYLRTPGVVIDLSVTGLHSGYAFNSALGTALNDAGVTLPQ
jgi:hypothetical protein